MNYHYLITDLLSKDTLDSRRFEDFDGYSTADRAKSVAWDRIKEHNLVSFTLEIIPTERKIKVINP